MNTFFRHLLRMLWAWTLPVRLLLMLIFAIFMNIVYVLTQLLSLIFLLKAANPLTYWMHNQWWCWDIETACSIDYWLDGKDTWISK